MGAATKIKQIMLEKDVSIKELSEKLDMKTPQVLSTKLYRDSMSFKDVEEIADALDCDVNITMRDTGKSF